MADLASVHVIVHGRVQGVNFRAFAARRAEELGLTGYVRNLANGAVEVVAEGERDGLKKLSEYLKTGPPSARVDSIVTDWSEYSGSYSEFDIRY